MTTQIEAVYENGVLRPLTPVNLHEQQHVFLTVSTNPLLDELLDVEYMEEMAAQADPSVTLDEVQRILSKIPGSMADVVIQDREDRI